MGRELGRFGGDAARAGRVALVLVWLIAGWPACDYHPTKSEYVSAVVRRECPPEEAKDTQALQACRLEVIKRFTDVPLEQMERLYPPPEPRPRPSCWLWWSILRSRACRARYDADSESRSGPGEQRAAEAVSLRFTLDDAPFFMIQNSNLRRNLLL